jgi:low affinity Fe/Cu permease
MQAKLDELIRAIDDARTQFVGIEHRTDAEIQKVRSDLETECDADDERGKPDPEGAIDRLISRT